MHSTVQVGLAEKKLKEPSDAWTAGLITHEAGAAWFFLPPIHRVFLPGPKFALLCLHSEMCPYKMFARWFTVKRMKR